MENNSETNQPNKSQEQKDDKGEHPLPFHNPLNPDDTRQITQEELENEQKYKEALSERD